MATSKLHDQPAKQTQYSCVGMKGNLSFGVEHVWGVSESSMKALLERM